MLPLPLLNPLTQHKVHHQEHVFSVLESEPQIDQEGVLKGTENFNFSKYIFHCMLPNNLYLIHVFHSIHLFGILLLDYADLERQCHQINQSTICTGLVVRADLAKSSLSDGSQNVEMIEIHYKEKQEKV